VSVSFRVKIDQGAVWNKLYLHYEDMVELKVNNIEKNHLTRYLGPSSCYSTSTRSASIRDLVWRSTLSIRRRCPRTGEESCSSTRGLPEIGFSWSKNR
jgi:hypothetical protein